MDFTAALVTVTGVVASIVAIRAFQKDHIEKPKEQKLALKTKFFANQKLALEIRQVLIDYTDKTQAHNEQFFQGITFENYIGFLTKTLERDLSNDLYERLSKEKIEESILQSMSQSLDDQNKNLLLVRGYLDLYFGSGRKN